MVLLLGLVGLVELLFRVIFGAIICKVIAYIVGVRIIIELIIIELAWFLLRFLLTLLCAHVSEQHVFIKVCCHTAQTNYCL